MTCWRGIARGMMNDGGHRANRTTDYGASGAGAYRRRRWVTALPSASRLVAWIGGVGALNPTRVPGYAMRTYSGRPSSSIRFSTSAAMATSLACRRGTVKLAACRGGRGRVAKRDDNACLPQLRRPPFPGRGHQLRGLAVFPLPAQPTHGQRNAGRSRHHRQPRDVRQWARKFGQAFANQIRRRLPCAGDK
jgi:hypothetical protein